MFNDLSRHSTRRLTNWHFPQATSPPRRFDNMLNRLPLDLGSTLKRFLNGFRGPSPIPSVM